MSQKQREKGDRHSLLSQDTVTPEDGSMTQGETMTFAQKLLLNASLWGNEACADFEQLYTVPILQTLGLPLSLVSLTGAIAGTSATLLLPFVGWLTDRGSNPHGRKTVATILACGISFAGMLCVILANVLHLDYLIENGANGTDGSSSYNSSIPFGKTHLSISHGRDGNETVSGREADVFGTVEGDGLLYSEVTTAFTNDSSTIRGATGVYVYGESSEVPFKAGLGLLGFIVMDIGFDISNACIKAFVVTCCPRSEHTSLLVIGLIMASSGGVSTAALGVVDFSSVLGLSYIAGARLTIQTTIQGVVIILFVTVGLATSLLTVRRLQRIRSSITDAESSSVKPADSHSSITNSTSSRQSTEHAPLLQRSGSLSKEDSEGPKSSLLASLSASYRSVSVPTGARLISPENLSEHLGEEQPLGNTFEVDGAAVGDGGDGGRSFKVKVVLISIATYCSTCDLFMFTLTGTDFVGKAVYGGNPEAPPGSQSLMDYQEGVAMASVGYLIYYIAFLACSIAQPRLLSRFGCRVVFTVVHLTLLAALVAASVTELLEVFFLLAVVAGFHRACVYSVPFAVINDLVQSRASERGGGGRNSVGMAISMLTAAMPLSYCTTWPWIGPLEEATGVVAIPFWFSAVTAFLATCAFLAVGKT
ncbi:uncharacterized protein LOC143298932 [Babylonia areolata]|uniref:uncharacterized protein LOC143298932 n=1 Tax=Babylonia areolata TaxID=304850 RepID=UPI003FD17D0F